MNYTDNYKLKKPEDHETAEIQDINDNADAIDAALKAVAVDAGGRETPAGAQAKVNAHNTSTNPHANVGWAKQANVYTKGETLTEATRAALGLAAGAVPDAAIAAVPHMVNAVWTKLKEYTVAGAYTWTAPDLFGGKPYLIGVLVIGGGGGGCAGCEAYYRAQGAPSAYSLTTQLLVTPGSSYAVVVGTGGEGGNSNIKRGISIGKGGGSSSFHGFSIAGGSGGTYYGSSEQHVGAQFPYRSEASSDSNYGVQSNFGGCILTLYNSTTGGIPTMCFNPFENKRILGAGGTSDSVQSYVMKGGKDPTTKKGGGDAIVENFAGALSAPAADAPGCGGGSCLNISTHSNSTATGGRGADGAVMIYIQGVPVA